MSVTGSAMARGPEMWSDMGRISLAHWLSLALAQNAFCYLKAVGADRNPAIDGDLDEHRAQLIRPQAVDSRAADMVGKLAHLAERGDHTESEDAALARR